MQKECGNTDQFQFDRFIKVNHLTLVEIKSNHQNILPTNDRIDFNAL